MWIASENGFFSIVKSSESKNTYMVRAREKRDLELLNKANKLNKKIFESEFNDYRFRIFINKRTLRRIMKNFANINYSNFKSHIASLDEQKHKVSYYSDIWGIMYQLQLELYHKLDYWKEYFQQRYGLTNFQRQNNQEDQSYPEPTKVYSTDSEEMLEEDYLKDPFYFNEHPSLADRDSF